MGVGTTRQPHVIDVGAMEEDVIALRRLIEYAIDEAERNGLFSCASLLRTARHQLDQRGAGAADLCTRFLEGRSPLPS